MHRLTKNSTVQPLHILPKFCLREAFVHDLCSFQHCLRPPLFYMTFYFGTIVWHPTHLSDLWHHRIHYLYLCHVTLQPWHLVVTRAVILPTRDTRLSTVQRFFLQHPTRLWNHDFPTYNQQSHNSFLVSLTSAHVLWLYTFVLPLIHALKLCGTWMVSSTNDHALILIRFPSIMFFHDWSCHLIWAWFGVSVCFLTILHSNHTRAPSQYF